MSGHLGEGLRRRLTCFVAFCSARQKENLESLSFDLTEEDLKAVSGLNQNLRLADPVGIHPKLAIYA